MTSQVLSPSVSSRRALRVLALYEAAKGLAALAAVVGVIDLMHHDIKHLAIELIGRFGLNPESRYPSVLLHYADLLPGANLPLMFFLAGCYILLRLSEAYGLWNARAWGEYLGAISGALYIPFELIHLFHRPTAFGIAVLAFNGLLVAYLAMRLQYRKRHQPGLN